MSYFPFNLPHSNNNSIFLFRTFAQSGIVSLTEYYNDQEGQKTLSSLAPDTFVLQEAAKKPTRTEICL
ncbi:hypothetical protein [Microbulbifer sp. A4B17]|uniref:hypothetical protein n=1 Tax=Microbulbifer sp. A4B17 TaxID=359370 RepID=UPI0013002B12|nr:hypothetical protein [Microbulbifer sp. A4B17]